MLFEDFEIDEIMNSELNYLIKEIIIMSTNCILRLVLCHTNVTRYRTRSNKVNGYWNFLRKNEISRLWEICERPFYVGYMILLAIKTESCWWQYSNRSLTSKTYHQQTAFSTFVTNIVDVTLMCFLYLLLDFVENET